jgi:2-oxoglutarate ferredoxin oxidoreductase subunit beta
MSYLPKPKFRHPGLPKNALGYTRRDYEGTVSTLCAGCGHDSISAAIVQACYELDLEPHRLAKLSGDGDSASIGLGQFAHAIRRGVDMLYIVENNGVYGLTKGQFSATADAGSKSKWGADNNDSPIDMVALALQLGATYVARSFSGDKQQLVPLIKGAIRHRGAAFIDCISPCVAFNNHAGSTKSFDYVREHNEAVNALDYMPVRSEIKADYAEGTLEQVTQHDGSVLNLYKLANDYDVHDRIAAATYLQRKNAEGEIATGLLYLDPSPKDLHGHLQTVDTALNRLGETDLVPGSAALEKFNAARR